jgi:hypothetical protein
MPDSVGTGPTLSTFTSPEPSGLDIPIIITKFPTAAASDRTEHRLPLRAILPALRDTRAAAKAALPWMKLASFGDQRTDRGSLRSDRNLLTIHGVEGDYDGEQITLDRARRVLEQAGLAAILYTSPSHTPQAPRWRVLCPTSVSLLPADRARLLARLNGLLVGALSRESWTLSQSYYYGAVGEAPHHAVIAIDGRPIDLAADLDAGALGKPEPPKPDPVAYTYQPQTLGDGIASPYARRALENECHAIASAPDGGKHHALNKAAYSIGGLVSAGEIDEGFAFSSLADALSAIRARCADFAAAERTLRQGFEDGKAARRTVPEAAPAFDPSGLGIFQQRADAQTEAPAGTTGQTGTKAPSVGLPMVYFDDAEPNLDAADFVEGVLTEGGMSVVYGESNCGKTFFATDLAAHVALGRKWNGRDIDQGGVIYCALEGSHGIMNRVAAFRRHHYLDGQDIPFAIIPVTLNLLDPNGDASRLVEAIQRAQDKMGVAVKLTVIDTLSRAMAGGNENAPDDMGALVTNDTKIRQATGAHNMWIHHSGKDAAKGARGHSLLRAATDTEVEIVRESKDAPSIATVRKQRDMEIEGEWTFGLKVVELGKNRRGKPVTSCVVEVKQASDKAPRVRLTGHNATAYEALVNAGAEAGASGYGCPEGVLSVPEDWWRDRFYSRAMPGAPQDTKKRTFRRAADALVEMRLVATFNGRVWAV